MATARDSTPNVHDLLDCPICFEVFQNARCLPCFHSFCLQCLKGYWNDKRAGQRVSCPVCREPFLIPQDGLDSIPRNFMVQKLMEIDSRSLGDSSTGGIPCEVHPDNKIEMYCCTCEKTVCRKCQKTTHKGHQCREIALVAEKFAKSLEEAENPVELRLGQFQSALEQHEDNVRQFLSSTETADCASKQQGEKVKNIVNGQVGKLLKELRELKSGEQKEAKSRKAALELAISEIQKFVGSSKELRTQGSAHDIVCKANDMQNQASRLLDTCVMLPDQVAPAVSFVPMNIDELMSGGQNLLGRLQRLSHADGQDNSVKEDHLQTERERQLEQQLIGIIGRLQNLTIQAMERQKKLQEEYHQAYEKLKLDQSKMKTECLEESFQCSENAKREIHASQMQNMRQKEELFAISCECRTACQQFLGSGQILERYNATKKSQRDASVKIDKLCNESRSEVPKYRIMKDNQRISESARNEAVRKALDRDNRLHHELEMSHQRRDNFECYLEELSDRTSDEVQQSLARQRKFRCLMSDIVTTLEEAIGLNTAYPARYAVQYELELVENQVKESQQDLDMSLERTGKLKQEISQLDKRERWLDKLEVTCGEDNSVHKLLQQTSRERTTLKDQLQQMLRSEEELFARLQEMQENRTLWKQKLEATSECLKKAKETVESTQKETEQIDQMCLVTENEEMLQKHLNDKQLRAEKVKKVISEEKRLEQKLQQMSGEESIFLIPVAQLKYRQSEMEEIGRIKLKHEFGNCEIDGLTLLHEELYVLCRRRIDSSVTYSIAVYCKNNFAFKRQFTVSGLSKTIQDMASCANIDCLLIADFDQQCLHKVVENDRNSPEMWPLSDKPYGLSEGRGWNVSVLVACHGESKLGILNTGKIKELDTSGRCVREIVLQPWLSSLRHAVELPSGQFVVAYEHYWCARGDSIAIVDKDGKVMQSYGSGWVPSVVAIRSVSHMAVDSDGFVFVAGMRSSCYRITLLNPSLQFVRFISAYPRRLHLDRNSRRLFVGHGNCVSVIHL